MKNKCLTKIDNSHFEAALFSSIGSVESRKKPMIIEAGGVMKKKNVSTKANFLLFMGILFVSYNNCTRAKFGVSDANIITSKGNGDLYDGKIGIYDHFDSINPCTETDRNGKPLPNSQVQVFAQLAKLTRDKCADVIPQILDNSRLVVGANGSLTLDSEMFQLTTLNEMTVRVAQCPTGSSPFPGANRKNLMPAALNLTDSQWNTSQGAVSAALNGSFAGLPLFQLERTMGASAQDWWRLKQFVDLSPNKRYVISFFAKTGISSEAKLLAYSDSPQVSQANVKWDLNTGATIEQNTISLLDASSASLPLSNGYFVSFYFRTPPGFLGMDIGVASGGLSLGDSIFVTGIQVEDVDSFCSP